MYTGHYYSIVKKEDKTWKRVDDDKSYNIKNDDVKEHFKNAYFCVYTRT
jgi:ubiquitin C-terminal hydrolase